MSYGHPQNGLPLPANGHPTTPMPFHFSPSPSPIIPQNGLPLDSKPLYQTTFSPSHPSPTPDLIPVPNVPSYSYNPTPYPSNPPTQSPLSEFIHRLDHLPGRRKRDVFGTPFGPPGFPIKPRGAEQDEQLRQAISDFLMSRNKTTSLFVTLP